MSSENMDTEGGAFRFKRSVSTLEHLSAVKISQSLWKGPLSKIASEILENDKKWDLISYCKIIFPQIEKETEKVFFPLIRIHILLEIMQKMSIQIYKWVSMRMYFFEQSKPWELINQFEWDSIGRIDEQKTARNMKNISEHWHPFLLGGKDPFHNHFFHNPILQKKKEALLRNQVPDGQNGIDIICFILDQMNLDQQAEVFRDYSVLPNLFSDLAWDDHFLPSLLHFFEYINARAFVALLELIVEELECNFRPIRNKQLFLMISQNVPPNLKEKLLEDYSDTKTHFMHDLFPSLFEMDLRELYEASLLVLFNSPHDKTSFFLSNKNYYHMSRKLVFESVDLEKAEELFRLFIDNEDQISKCKRGILEEGKGSYLSKFWTEGKFEQLDQILSFCFSSSQEIALFKREFFNQDDSLDHHFFVDMPMCRIIREKGLKYLDELFSWIVGDAHDEDAYKKEIFSDKRITFICLNLLKGPPPFSSVKLDDFLKWCFMDAGRVKHFKEALFKKLTMEGFILTFRYVDIAYAYEDFLKELIHWLNPSPEMIKDGILNIDQSGLQLDEFDSVIYNILVDLKS